MPNENSLSIPLEQMRRNRDAIVIRLARAAVSGKLPQALVTLAAASMDCAIRTLQIAVDILDNNPR